MSQPIVVIMTDTTTGEVASYSDTGNFEPDENGFDDRYMWEEGNWACDCNRGIMFQTALGNTEGEYPTPCGSTRYRVRIVDLDDVVLYEDEA